MLRDRIADLQTYLPAWLASLLIFAAALLAALLIHFLLFRFLTRISVGRAPFVRSVVARTRQVAMLMLLIIAVASASTLSSLSTHDQIVVRHILVAGFIIVVMWLIRSVLHIWTTFYLRRFELNTSDNIIARKHVTQSRILLRVADTLIVVIGIGAILMTFDTVRQYGVSLLASAGAAGIVVGLALQPMLKNLFAGVQLAITQPIRIDDAVIVEGEWGNIEEITSTYVVVRIWDLRRLIVPLNYFIEKPFQNWTREQSKLIGSVIIYLDYSVPVAKLREKAEEIARQSPNWDHDVVNVQVTDFHETVMQVRILASASNSGKAFDLRCEMREKLIDYLVEEYPEALPRVRSESAAKPDSPEHTAAIVAGGNGSSSTS